jgi:hypothetical protein
METRRSDEDLSDSYVLREERAPPTFTVTAKRSGMGRPAMHTGGPEFGFPTPTENPSFLFGCRDEKDQQACLTVSS